MHRTTGTRGISRRAFVAGLAGSTAGLAFAGPALAGPALARPARRARVRPGANSIIQVGMIGMGIRGRNIMNGSVLKNARMRIVAMCDVDRTRLDHYCGKAEAHYEDPGSIERTGIDREVFEREDVDAVIIATPDHWHATQCLWALAAGKHVYCEKPLTHTLREGRLLTEAAGRSGLAFLTGSQQRTEYGHRFSRAVDLIRNGAIGRVLTVNIGVGDPPSWCDLGGEEAEPGLDWDRWLGPAPERAYHSDLSPRGVHGHYPVFRRYIEYSGGYLADMGAHHYDIAHWALGLDASGPARVIPPADGASKRGARLVYPNGVVITHGGPSGATFVGERGMLHVDRGRTSSVPAKIMETDLGEDAVLVPRPPGHMDHFLDCIEGKAQPICGAEAGARTAAACQLTNLAYRLRRELVWDAERWRFEGDEVASALLDYDRRSPFELPAG